MWWRNAINNGLYYSVSYEINWILIMRTTLPFLMYYIIVHIIGSYSICPRHKPIRLPQRRFASCALFCYDFIKWTHHSELFIPTLCLCGSPQPCAHSVLSPHFHPPHPSTSLHHLPKAGGRHRAPAALSITVRFQWMINGVEFVFLLPADVQMPRRTYWHCHRMQLHKLRC